jgi:hypothetical protein
MNAFWKVKRLDSIVAVEFWPGMAGELRECRVEVGEIIWDSGESANDIFVILSGLNVKLVDIPIV